MITTKLGILNCLRDYYCQSRSSSAHGGAGSNSTTDYSEDPHESSVEVLASVFQEVQNPSSLSDEVAQAVHDKSNKYVPTPWMPETYQLDIISDCLALIEADRVAQAAPPATPGEVSALWIYKPSSSNRGRGIQVMKGGKELLDLLRDYHPSIAAGDASNASVSDSAAENVTSTLTATNSVGKKEMASSPAKKKAATFVPPLPKAIVQKYILRPLLVDGYKFDLRCYMLIARVSPTYLVYFHPGYAR